MELEDFKKLHDKAYLNNQTTRERAADDLVFYWITQWGEKHFQNSTIQIRMQFDQIRKAGRKIITDLKTNPIQVDFQPVDGTDDSLADTVEGMYRADMRNNIALEAKENASVEAMVCGFGAWEEITKEVAGKRGRKRQKIQRMPIYEANNVAFCDPNARLQDKSDSDYWSILVPYTCDGYIKLVKDLTGEEVDDNYVESSFATPETGYSFDWFDSSEVYYISRFYHRTYHDETIYVYQDIMGDVREVAESEIDDELESELELSGYQVIEEYEKEVKKVKLYILGGDVILAEYDIPGDKIPVIPMYGERAIIEGEEHYEGITRLAKDPQRLRNFIGSYIADIAARTPLRQPIYLPEQIAGFEYMYEQNGADQVYPYLLQNRMGADGQPLPIGAVGASEPQELPSSAAQAFELATASINDVAGEPLPGNISDTDLSGEALKELRGKMEAQSYIYQHNLKAALRRDAEVYVGIASVIYDTEQSVTVVKVDGARARETINEKQIEPSSLQIKYKNNLKDAEFEVYADIGASYSSMREKSLDDTKEMLRMSPPDDPMRKILQLKFYTENEGEINKPMRDYARKQLVLMGVYPPETDEEKMMMAQAMQQEQQPDPAMVMAQAEMGKAQAEQMNAQSNMVDKQVDMYNAETKRQEVQIKAAQAGVDIENKKVDTAGKILDNSLKLRQSVNL